MFQRHKGCHCVIKYNNNGNKTYQSGKGGKIFGYLKLIMTHKLIKR